MSDATISDAVPAAGAAIGEAVGIFMLHPETSQEGIDAGYPDPFAAYFAGRAGVLGDANAETVSAVFAVFEPNVVKMCWETGTKVRGAAESAAFYWDQIAGFGRRHLSGVPGLDRLAALGEKVIAAAPDNGLPLFAGWRAMPLADDAPARALQVMMVLRELRAAVHFCALSLSGVSPVEAHMLHGGPDYAAFMGWQPPYADGVDKKNRYAATEELTNHRMAEIVGAALSDEEADELARLSTAVLTALKSGSPAAADA